MQTKQFMPNSNFEKQLSSESMIPAIINMQVVQKCNHDMTKGLKRSSINKKKIIFKEFIG